jgi:hypothetical protein
MVELTLGFEYTLIRDLTQDGMLEDKFLGARKCGRLVWKD